MSYKFLGLDISSNSTGWAVLEDDVVIEYGIIKTEGTGLDKLVSFHTGLANVLDQHSDVAWIAMEDTYLQSVKAMKTLTRYGGVALLDVAVTCRVSSLLFDRDINDFLERRKNPRGRIKIPRKAVYLMMPNSVFRWIETYCPNNREDKKQESIAWVDTNLHISLSREEDDIADALCLGFAAKECFRKLGGYDDNCNWQ